MPGFNQQQTADAYAAATTIENVWNARGGWFSVGVAPVFVQMQYGTNAMAYWTEEQELGSGAFGFFPPNCVGCQFRSAISGSPATVTAWISQGGEPNLQISALGTITTSGVAPTRTIITTPGSGTYTTPSGCVAILVECIGGGGGGGGAGPGGGGAGTQCAAGGGGGGAYAAKLIASPAGAYGYTVGAAGAGGAPTPAAGGAGGDTSLGGLVLAKGGSGGSASGASTTTPITVCGAAGGSQGASTGDVTLGGGAGGRSFAISGTIAVSGYGGFAARGGGGGLAVNGVSGSGSTGGAGQDYGGGGAGGAGIGSGYGAGGSGAPGLIIVTEFY